MEDQFCRLVSLLCFEDGPLHIDPLWRLFVISRTVTVKTRSCSYSRHAAHPEEGSDKQLATVKASPNQHRVSYPAIVDPFSPQKRTQWSLDTNCLTVPADMTWLSWIIHLLHHATPVTEMLLWSRSSNHNRSLNELHFPPIYSPENTSDTLCA